MRNPYRVLALYENHELLEQFIEEFEDYPIYDIRAIPFSDYDDTRKWDNIDIIIAL
jgi:hypothetical protein